MIAPVLVTCALALALIAALWVAVVDDPDGGQPVAVATIVDAPPETTGSLTGRTVDANRPRPGLSADGRPNAASAALGAARPPDVFRATGQPLDALVEETAFGLLPRIGEDGLRPLDAYARPASAGPRSGAPRVVLVVGGLGISQTGTQAAIEALPEDVTLAFAPYGGSLDRWVGRAREDGHEVLVQAPLEPYGYPETDPGEHTLVAAADPEENAESLRWVLGRMTSYTGVMNYMGGQFTGDATAMGAFLTDLAARGLFYLDDGSSPSSLAAALGHELDLPVVTADIVVDRDRAPDQIKRALEELERLARSNGLAVGVATAFPASVEAIAAWAEQATARGVALVPASAALAR